MNVEINSCSPSACRCQRTLKLNVACCLCPCRQPVKSFKLRGAYNKMAQLTPEQVRGVKWEERGGVVRRAG